MHVSEERAEKLALLKQKGVYPYSYMNSWERFEETCIPPRACFFNTLKNCDITDADYARVCRIFSIFELKTLGELHDLYVATDVLLLTNVMERHRCVYCKR